MFEIAVLIGIYSYLIFFLGIFGLLYTSVIFYISIIFFLSPILFYHKTIVQYCTIVFSKITHVFSYKRLFRIILSNKFVSFLVLLLTIQVAVNLIGAFGPELAFDALWYHLTIPKIFLINHKIFYIPGGLLYYSVMPKLADLLYIPALAFGNEITAKLIHFSFGILTCIALYKLSRKFFNGLISFLVVLIFYSNLVIDWESITAYIDLARTFFELMALWGFINWWEKGKLKWLIASAVMIGFAVCVKLLALGSLLIFTVLILYKHIIIDRQRWVVQSTKDILIYWYISIFLIIPWLVFSFVNTGSPVYPFFSHIYNIKISIAFLDPFYFIKNIWMLFTHAADPISPIYIIFLPLIIYFFRSLKKEIRVIMLYSFLSLVVWYITPRTGGGRFIMPYLPAFSIIIGAVLERILSYKKFNLLKIICLQLVITVSTISILYRGIANFKYLPVILGQETKSEFLTKHLNFSFGDFYDINSGIKNIVGNHKVLLYGFHNLYYVDFPFVDSSFVNKGEKFNYVATQSVALPARFADLKIVYSNPITYVKLYRESNNRWISY